MAKRELPPSEIASHVIQSVVTYSQLTGKGNDSQFWSVVSGLSSDVDSAVRMTGCGSCEVA